MGEHYDLTVSSDGSLGSVSTIGMVELSSLLSGGWPDFRQVIFSTQITQREREREKKKRKRIERYTTKDPRIKDKTIWNPILEKME